MKIRAPKEVQELLTAHWERNKDSQVEEVWPVGNGAFGLTDSLLLRRMSSCLTSLTCFVLFFSVYQSLGSSYPYG